MEGLLPQESGQPSHLVLSADDASLLGHSDGEHTDDELLAEIEGLLSDAEATTSPRGDAVQPHTSHEDAENPDSGTRVDVEGTEAPKRRESGELSSTQNNTDDGKGQRKGRKLRWRDDGEDDGDSKGLEDIRPFDKREPVEAVAAPPLSPSNEFEWVLVEQLNQRKMITRL